MEKIIERVKKSKYDLRDIDLIDIVQFKIFDSIISLEELKRIKNLIDSTINNVKKEIKNGKDN